MVSLYKGTFNYYGENMVLYTRATNESKAYTNFISQIAKRLHVGKHTIVSRFDGKIDNYRIEKVLGV